MNNNFIFQEFGIDFKSCCLADNIPDIIPDIDDDDDDDDLTLDFNNFEYFLIVLLLRIIYF